MIKVPFQKFHANVILNVKILSIPIKIRTNSGPAVTLSIALLEILANAAGKRKNEIPKESDRAGWLGQWSV